MEKAGEAVEAVTEGAKEMAEKAADDAGEAMAKMTEATEDAAKGAGEAMTADKNTHTVVRGDTLWEIARTHYGDPVKWKAIAEANPQLNPHRIDVGMEINLPTAN